MKYEILTPMAPRAERNHRPSRSAHGHVAVNTKYGHVATRTSNYEATTYLQLGSSVQTGAIQVFSKHTNRRKLKGDLHSIINHTQF